MFITKGKLCAAFLLCIGVKGYDALTPDAIQPELWEIKPHGSYETVMTVCHRYSGECADPLDVHIIKNNSGEAIEYRWSPPFVASISDKLNTQTEPWVCEPDEKGSLQFSNQITGEIVDPIEVRMGQALLGYGSSFCQTDHPRDGFIRAYVPG